MVGVLADHAVGVGEMVEEAAGWIVLPSKGRSDAFQIHPNNATLMAVVKMGVLHGARAEHQAISVGTSQVIELFLKRAFHGSKGSVLLRSSIGIIRKFPDS